MTEHITHQEIESLWDGNGEPNRRTELLDHLISDCPHCITMITEFPEYPNVKLEADAELLESTLLLVIACHHDSDLLKMFGPELQYFITQKRFGLAYVANAAERIVDLSSEEAIALLRATHGETQRVFPEFDEKSRDVKAFAASCLAHVLLRVDEFKEAREKLDSCPPAHQDKLIPPVALHRLEESCSQFLMDTARLDLLPASLVTANKLVETSDMPGQMALHLWRRAGIYGHVAAIPTVVESLLYAREALTIRSIPLESHIADALGTTLVQVRKYQEALRVVKEVKPDVREHDPAIDAHLHYLAGFSLYHLQRTYEADPELNQAVIKLKARGSVEHAMACLCLLGHIHQGHGDNTKVDALAEEHQEMLISDEGQQYLKGIPSGTPSPFAFFLHSASN